ncbi:hypothetical protein C8J57DRAFT_1229820 [Mycena rebaudengoi]|nr:hypothetical protein C8J57DRAFT_1229820 [Mycena rebaudengoi]
MHNPAAQREQHLHNARRKPDKTQVATPPSAPCLQHSPPPAQRARAARVRRARVIPAPTAGRPPAIPDKTPNEHLRVKRAPPLRISPRMVSRFLSHCGFSHRVRRRGDVYEERHHRGYGDCDGVDRSADSSWRGARDGRRRRSVAMVGEDAPALDSKGAVSWRRALPSIVKRVCSTERVHASGATNSRACVRRAGARRKRNSDKNTWTSGHRHRRGRDQVHCLPAWSGLGSNWQEGGAVLGWEAWKRRMQASGGDGVMVVENLSNCWASRSNRYEIIYSRGTSLDGAGKKK